MPSTYLAASFGDVPILIASIETERGRDIVVHSPSSGDHHSLSDRGRRALVVRCEILFVDQPGLEPYLERRDRFLRIAESGEPQIFTHPIDGAYVARAENVSESASSDQRSVRISCTFLQDSETQRVFPMGAGGSAAAGVESVTVAAAAADQALVEVGLSSSAPATCVAAVTAWESMDDIDANEVMLKVASVTHEIDESISQLELRSSLDYWTSYQQLILLRYQVVRAAELFTSSVEQVFDVHITTPRPLRAICAEIYGAAEAEERTAQVVKLNRLRTPARVPANTTLKFPRAA